MQVVDDLGGLAIVQPPSPPPSTGLGFVPPSPPPAVSGNLRPPPSPTPPSSVANSVTPQRHSRLLQQTSFAPPAPPAPPGQCLNVTLTTVLTHMYRVRASLLTLLGAGQTACQSTHMSGTLPSKQLCPCLCSAWHASCPQSLSRVASMEQYRDPYDSQYRL